MGSLVQVLNEWEIQLLVLLSFTLQVFLFFTGGLRRRSTNALLRFSMWVAYLGADLVAIYALGFLSRHTDDTCGKDTLMEAHPLAFLWAPFLLMHLGGQDTVTAFAIEDNNLWLRHLLNLVVQVGVALYIFWDSMAGRGHHSVLLPGISVFISGIIKYAERTLALMYGDLKNTSHNNEELNRLANQDGYLGIFASALNSAPGIRALLAGRTLHQMEVQQREVLTSDIHMDHLPKLLEVELDLMYDDIYTKAMVLRTKSGIILRCVSQVSIGVAFVLFIVNNKHRYSREDLAITYVLFIGGFCLEICAVFILLMSPWTWAGLEAQNCRWLARISSLLLCSDIGRPKIRPLWSNSMGQYNFLCYLGCDQQSSWLSKLVKKVAKTASLVVSSNKEAKPMLWMSKLLDTKYAEVDKEIMDSVIRIVCQYSPDESPMDAKDWPKLGPLLNKLLPDYGASFGYAIVCFHIFTEAHIRGHFFFSDLSDREKILVSACRKLSNYMLYLLVTYPEMLPVSGTPEPTLLFFLRKTIPHVSDHGASADILPMVNELLVELGLIQVDVSGTETLNEMRDLWTRLLIYCAGKSRAEMHAAQLSRGGELLTFAWLLMAHKELGDVGRAFNFNFPTQPNARLGAMVEIASRRKSPPAPYWASPRRHRLGAANR